MLVARRESVTRGENSSDHMAYYSEEGTVYTCYDLSRFQGGRLFTSEWEREFVEVERSSGRYGNKDGDVRFDSRPGPAALIVSENGRRIQRIVCSRHMRRGPHDEA